MGSEWHARASIWNESLDRKREDQVMLNPPISRRSFLRRSMVLAGGVVVAPAALQGLTTLGTNGRVYAAPGDGGYGPLFPTADLRDGVARISLPEGFQYRSLGVAGTPMSDGNLDPLGPRRHGRISPRQTDPPGPQS
jgi:hypothetical protein